MSNRRVSVFIGSSSEGLQIAEALQANLDEICETTIWSQGIFGLSQGTMEALVEELKTVDFAILALTPDDLSLVREEMRQAPRDNVLLEFGLCIGVLGRERTFAVYDRSSQIRIPSDLAGVTLATYQLHKSGNIRASLGAASTKIKQAIGNLGPRSAGVMEVNNSVFLAAPMNAFNEAGKPDDYPTFQAKLLSLIKALRTECGMAQVFCAAEKIPHVKAFDLPAASLALDIEKIQEHKFFVLIWKRDVVSKSVLIETGMALAMGKQCILCVEHGAVLPFILQDASAAVPNVRKIDYETIDELVAELTRNKSWLFHFKRNGKLG